MIPAIAPVPPLPPSALDTIGPMTKPPTAFRYVRNILFHYGALPRLLEGPVFSLPDVKAPEFPFSAKGPRAAGDSGLGKDHGCAETRSIP